MHPSSVQVLPHSTVCDLSQSQFGLELRTDQRYRSPECLQHLNIVSLTTHTCRAWRSPSIYLLSGSFVVSSPILYIKLVMCVCVFPGSDGSRAPSPINPVYYYYYSVKYYFQVVLPSSGRFPYHFFKTPCLTIKRPRPNALLYWVWYTHWHTHTHTPTSNLLFFN